MFPSYLPDATIDDALDSEIRGLLTTCFTGPQDAVFHHRRWFIEPYPHRWIIRDAKGSLVAHVGVHEKSVQAGDAVHPIAGIGEVCVHPDHRGRGHVRSMLACVHPAMSDRGFTFALLFGDPKVYSSSGYRVVKNLVHDHRDKDGHLHRRSVTGMVRELGPTPWPSGEVYLPGPVF